MKTFKICAYSMNFLEPNKNLFVSFQNLFDKFLTLENFRPTQIMQATDGGSVTVTGSGGKSRRCEVICLTAFCFLVFNFLQTSRVPQMIFVHVDGCCHVFEVKAVCTLCSF